MPEFTSLARLLELYPSPFIHASSASLRVVFMTAR